MYTPDLVNTAHIFHSSKRRRYKNEKEVVQRGQGGYGGSVAKEIELLGNSRMDREYYYYYY